MIRFCLSTLSLNIFKLILCDTVSCWALVIASLKSQILIYHRPFNKCNTKRKVFKNLFPTHYKPCQNNNEVWGQAGNDFSFPAWSVISPFLFGSHLWKQ